MKMLVTNDLEKHHVAVVLHVWVGLEAADRSFQILNIRRPRVAEKLVSRRDRRRSSAVAVLG
jgi:hypothetical protein